MGKNICINDNLVLDANSIWYISPEYQMLVKLNRRTGNITYVKDLPIRYAHRHIVKYNDHIYMFPFNESREIIDFDIISEQIEMISIPKELFLEKEIDCKFYGSAKYKESIFVFGELPIILQFNPINKKCIIHRGIEELLSGCKYPYYFWRAGYVEDNLLIIPFYSSPMILIFNMDNGKCEIKKIDEKEATYGINCIDFDGIDYWMTTVRNGFQIIRWNRDRDVAEKIMVKESVVSDDDVPFYGLVCSNGAVWLMPAKSDMAYKLDCSSGKIESLDVPAMNVNALKNDWHHNYMNCIKIDSKTFLSINLEFKTIVEVDTCTGKIELIPVKISHDIHESIHKIAIGQIRRAIKKNHILSEYYYDIRDYINIIGSFNNKQGSFHGGNQQKIVGKDIYLLTIFD